MQDATESNLGAAVNKLPMLTPFSSSLISLAVAMGLVQGELEPASPIAAAIRTELAKSSGSSNE